MTIGPCGLCHAEIPHALGSINTRSEGGQFRREIGFGAALTMIRQNGRLGCQTGRLLSGGGRSGVQIWMQLDWFCLGWLSVFMLLP